MTYGEIFKEIGQLVSAFKNWKHLYGDESDYGYIDEGDYLGQAYMFLSCPATKEFVEFCAKEDGLTLDEYCLSMGIDRDKLD